MAPFIIIVAILIVVIFVGMLIIICVPVHELSDTKWLVVFGITVAAFVSACILVYNWDDILVHRADQFMLTRDAAYACADMGPSSCQKSILEWQKDSTWYADNVSDILEHIKE